MSVDGSSNTHPASKKYNIVCKKWKNVSIKYNPFTKKYDTVSKKSENVSEKYNQVTKKHDPVRKKWKNVSKKYNPVTKKRKHGKHGSEQITSSIHHPRYRQRLRWWVRNTQQFRTVLPSAPADEQGWSLATALI